MHNFQVWIVEDEPLSAKYIKAIVSGFDMFEVSQWFESAEAALQEFQNSKPDLLITDIKLLGMSGLELLKEIRKTDSTLLAIVISGYRLFEFAKEAITLSIMDYLLKPIDKQKLEALLIDARSLLLEQKRSIRRTTIIDLLENDKSAEYNLQTFPYRHIRLTIITRAGDFSDVLEQYDQKISMIDDDRLVLVPYQTNSIVVLEGIDEEKDRPLTSRILATFSYDQGKQIPNQFIITSNRIYQPAELKKACEGLYALAQSNFSFKPMTQVLPVEEISERNSQNLMESEIFSNLLSKIYPKDWSGFKGEFSLLSQEWEKQQLPLCIIKNQVLVIIDKLQLLFPSILISSLLYEQAGDVITSCFSYEELGVQLQELFEETIQHITQGTTDEAEYDLFSRITDYLRQDVQANHSLSELSDHFGVSQPYLSKLFRTYAGSTFKEYLLSFKINTAVSMMEANPSMLMKEVATAVGFEPLYFSTVFCRLVGQYPTQFVKTLHETKH